MHLLLTHGNRPSGASFVRNVYLLDGCGSRVHRFVRPKVLPAVAQYLFKSKIAKLRVCLHFAFFSVTLFIEVIFLLS